MQHFRVVSLASLAILLAMVAAARADSDSSPAAKLAVQGTYSCGFDSASGYQAPGTNSSVEVGGVFTIAVDKTGAITQGSADFSVDDGGMGPAVCSYPSGTGSISLQPLLGSLGSATLNLVADNKNSTLCPPGNGSLAFSPTSDGLQFIYTNGAGFVGHGTCGLAAVPAANQFQCTYTAKNTALGNGAGVGTVFFAPKLKDFALSGFAAIYGKDIYPSISCPYAGPVGVAFFLISAGGWNAPAPVAAGCPTTPFENVNLRTNAKTIIVTAPGLANVTCSPVSTVATGAGKISVSPKSINFGKVSVGVTSPPQTVTLTNTGTGDLNFLGFATADPFGSDPSACDSPLAPGDSCPVQITFAPTKKGAARSTLGILNGGSNKITNVKLVGVGD
jgi:hypothetical protein